MSQKGFYIPSLDGLRAIAVLLVFAAHAGLSHLVPGGLGVTIFFFLSGFLITTLMRLEFEKTGALSFGKFYLRRVYRILPPFYLVLALVLLLALSGALQSDMQWGAVAAQAAQFTNYYLIIAGAEHTVPGLTVLWSLSVEEHFYLLFPLVFLAMARRVGNRKMASIIALFCGAVLAWRLALVLGMNAPPERTYYASDTRIDSIMFGSILALWKNPVLDAPMFKSNRAALLALFAAGALMLFTLVYREPVFRETLRYSLQGLALLPLFALAIAKSHWQIFRWLEFAPLRFVGKVSYTAYLIHPTAIGLVEQNLHTGFVLTLVLSLTLTLGFSAAMYHLVERHMAALRSRLHT